MTMCLSRRKTLGLLAAAPLAMSLAAARALADLGAAAARAGLTYGASASQALFDDAAYRLLYLKHCRAITSDVDLKFDWLRPHGPARWEWGPADRLVAFAGRTGMAFRGHALIWNENPPRWLRKLSLAEIRRVFDEHIDTVVGRYAGRVAVWDVVNEPFWPGHGKPGGYRDGPWLAAFGSSYVARAFKRARAADPKAVLAVNEAHCERDDAVGRAIRKGMRRLVDELLEAGAPLDALGFQGHLQPQLPYDDARFSDFLHELGAKVARLDITELDVNDENFPDDVKRRDALVARRYREFLTHVLRVKQVRSVINWQLADHYSWYAALARDGELPSRRPPRPLPFDAAYRPKPAFFAMLAAFEARSRKPETGNRKDANR